MRWSKDGLKIATNLFEAACWHYAVKPVCRCGHHATFNPHGLWWHFERRGWNDRLDQVRGHMWCRICRSRKAGKIRPTSVELVQEGDGDLKLPWPPEDVWKRAISRMRT